MPNIAKQIEAVRSRIRDAERRFGRPRGAVRLLAVSKTRPAADIRAAHREGLRCFAESYLQEALEKIEALADLDVEWHFIGPIQSNKTRLIARHFSWVHSVDRLKVARRLDEQRPADLGPLNLCLQVNISGEPSKSGSSVEALAELATQVANFPRLRLRGLMAIPARTPHFATQRASFRTLRLALEGLNSTGLALDTLSMGMSEDLEAAIAEGATLVRVGTAIFGVRPKKPGMVSSVVPDEAT